MTSRNFKLNFDTDDDDDNDFILTKKDETSNSGDKVSLDVNSTS